MQHGTQMDACEGDTRALCILGMWWPSPAPARFLRVLTSWWQADTAGISYMAGIPGLWQNHGAALYHHHSCFVINTMSCRRRSQPPSEYSGNRACLLHTCCLLPFRHWDEGFLGTDSPATWPHGHTKPASVLHKAHHHPWFYRNNSVKAYLGLLPPS